MVHPGFPGAACPQAPYNEKRKSNIEKLRNTRAKRPNLLQTILDKFDDLVG